MDWSVLRMHAKYPLLRPELVYTDYIPVRVFLLDRLFPSDLIFG